MYWLYTIVTDYQLKSHKISVCFNALDSTSRLAQQSMTRPMIQPQYKTHLCWPRQHVSEQFVSMLTEGAYSKVSLQK